MKKAIIAMLLCVMLLVSNIAAVAVSAEELYSDNWFYLDVGTTTVEADTAYPYTLFVVAPSETGKYIISCDDALIGIVSYTDMWVQQVPGDNNVNANTVEWQCTAVGQGIVVAAQTAAMLTVTVAEEAVQEQEDQWVYYENQTPPTAFTLAGASKTLAAVNTTDDVVDCAVLGADGYYHLNTADGPVLFANVKDTKMSLATIITYGQVKEVLQDENYTILSKTDFNAAAEEYINCSDSKTGLYPLTYDLIEIFTRVGNNKGWYGATGYVGGELEDAWMFACYYVDGGDVTMNGAVDAADVAQLFQYVNGATTLYDGEAMVGDVNGDGVVNFADVARLFYVVNGRV